MKLLFSKRSPLSVQLFTSLALALTLIVLDIHYRPFKEIRYYLDTIISPLYQISNFPRSSFDSLYEMSKTRETLISENTTLHAELLQQKNDLLLLEHLKHENGRLRQLLGSPLRHDEHKMAAQVLLADTDPYVYQFVLNKGKQDGVYVGQPVVDEKGIVGQIYETAQSTSRAILVCDYQHAIPVQVLRNDISMVAVGNGCSNDLTLEFLSNNVDIKVGDVLVTSGLDGRFPEGYPVAVVSSVKLDITDSTPIISATPTADLKRLRYLLLLWGNEGAKYEGS
ncbi:MULTISPECIES: rod shape-determining protein MreC [unclassified Gilliamella]|uniref:rod shape-determining protein MreC n=1 Tax=unclassified Gilliamella TaxID=2685620 RepID=UPI001308C4C0|nr:MULTISPECIES: rod shape-determining protein MreC [unclassified Gilliamella]MWP48610.1 rod shape-determining protein MreC [Gilliamella sp. Lep-s35]MWP68672.1 rod shape-determining protein MreC [Gilliamella sp. Lep-s5]MWP76660.1 rod shape-determining protein MreC [Gilliamella sp. Lep-s21]